MPAAPDPYPATLALSLVKLQAAMPRVGMEREADTGSYRYKYAGLHDVVEALYPALSAVGLAFTASTALADGRFILESTLHHHAGDTMLSTYPLPDPGRATAQQIGSAITYGRRYCLTAMTGLVVDPDDDAKDVGPSEPMRTRQQEAADRMAAQPDQADPPDPRLVAELRRKGLQATALPMADRRPLLQALYREAQQARVVHAEVAVPGPWQEAADTDTLTLGGLLTGCQKELPAHGEDLGPAANEATGEVQPEPAEASHPKVNPRPEPTEADRAATLAAAQQRARAEKRAATSNPRTAGTKA